MDLEQVRQEIKGFKKDIDAANRLLQDIARLDKQRDGNLSKLQAYLTKLEKMLQTVGQASTSVNNVHNWLDTYRQELTAAQETIKKQFGAELECLLKEQGINLAGQYPRLKAGLFTIELDFDNERVKLWYGPQQEYLSQCSLAADKVAEQTLQAKKQLGSALQPEEFLARLQKAVSRVVGNAPDQPAPIIQVLGEMAHLMQTSHFYTDPSRENFKSYSRADFSYDLFRIRSVAGTKFRLSTATRAQTRNRRDFLWIPNNEIGDGMTYSQIQILGGKND